MVSVEQLWSEKYKLMDELIHDDIVPFIKFYLFRWNLVTTTYLISNLLPIFLMLYLFFKLPAGFQDYEEIFSQTSLGVALFIPLIPIHEVIHAVAYKLEGAKVVSIHAQWSKLIFLASAHHFVANSKSFFIVAIAPFLLINLSLFVGFIIFDEYWKWFFLSAFLIHTSGCAGDFALLSYFWHNRKLKVFTYDDMDLKKSYFFSEITQ
jgi:hypothetical protein